MAKRKNILIDELYVELRVPRELAEAECESIRHTLMQADFLRQLRRAIRGVLTLYPTLAPVRAVVSR